MKRDYELIRKLLLHLEGSDIDLNSYTADQQLYHKAYLCDANLAEGTVHYPSTTHIDIPDLVHIKKLTPQGHDLIDSIREECKWGKVKNWINNTGKTLSIELIKVATSELIKSSPAG